MCRGPGVSNRGVGEVGSPSKGGNPGSEAEGIPLWVTWRGENSCGEPKPPLILHPRCSSCSVPLLAVSVSLCAVSQLEPSHDGQAPVAPGGSLDPGGQ